MLRDKMLKILLQHNPPGSGRRADIDGRQVRAKTGREQAQQ
jgi:hypothetical protein